MQKVASAVATVWLYARQKASLTANFRRVASIASTATPCRRPTRWNCSSKRAAPTEHSPTKKLRKPTDLARIITAAHRAPTATNAQGVKILLVTKPEVLKEISQLTIDTFNAAADKLENPLLKPLLKCVMAQNYRYIPVFRKLREEWKQGNDGILRRAKAALFFYTDSASRFGCQDSNLAYQNASLMAESLGVAQFYTGFVCSAAAMDKKRKLYHLLGIEGTIHAGMALGMPAFIFDKYIDRKELDLKVIE